MLNTVSITDLKQNTASVVEKVKSTGKSVVVIQRSEPAAVLVDPKYYQLLEEAFEDMEDLRDMELRKDEATIPFEEYFKNRFAKVKK